MVNSSILTSIFWLSYAYFNFANGYTQPDFEKSSVYSFSNSYLLILRASTIQKKTTLFLSIAETERPAFITRQALHAYYFRSKSNLLIKSDIPIYEQLNSLQELHRLPEGKWSINSKSGLFRTIFFKDIEVKTNQSVVVETDEQNHEIRIKRVTVVETAELCSDFQVCYREDKNSE